MFMLNIVSFRYYNFINKFLKSLSKKTNASVNCMQSQNDNYIIKVKSSWRKKSQWLEK